jgi:aminopeptidase-like protein
LLPGLQRHRVASGEQVFDWTVPPEWNIRAGHLRTEDGTTVVDFCNNNLHVLGYSEPVDCWVTLDELQGHLHSLPEQPDWIPYVTSYYRKNWGFCMTHRQRATLKPGRYRAFIDSTLQPGFLDYADLVLQGRESSEVLFSTYVCHPSMANNELSGPAVVAALAQHVANLSSRRYTYRFVFIPETIGSIVYLSRSLTHLKERLAAGFVVTCAGDDRAYSYVPSRLGSTLADRVARHALRHHAPDYVAYSFLERGSDERQYCSPGVDLPVCSVMRTKYGVYPEYHTSADNLELVTASGLCGAFEVYRKIITLLENNYGYRVTVQCEPQLGKRGLYPNTSTKSSGELVKDLMNVIAYADGRDLVELADTVGLSGIDVINIIQPLLQNRLLEVI